MAESDDAPSPYLPFTPEMETDFVFSILVGAFIMFTLWGIALLQFYHVSRLLYRSPQKEYWNFAVLASFFLVDLTDTITKFAYVLTLVKTVVVEGQAGAAKLPRTIFAIAFTSGLIAMMTHFFYARRVWKITSTWANRRAVLIALIFALVLSVTQFIAAFWSGFVALLPMEEWPKHQAVAIIWLAGSSTVDFFLCFMLVAYLRSMRSTFTRTNNLLQKWTVVVLETGLFPAMIQITELVLFLAYKAKPYNIAINFGLPKTYVNCVLVLFVTVLSSRASLVSEKPSVWKPSSTSNFKKATSTYLNYGISTPGVQVENHSMTLTDDGEEVLGIEDEMKEADYSSASSSINGRF